ATGMSPGSPHAWLVVTLLVLRIVNHVPLLGRHTVKSARVSPSKSEFACPCAVDWRYSAISALTSLAVNSPVSESRKHEFMSEPPTTAPDGVPAIRFAPT